MKEFYTSRPSIGRNIERIRKIKDMKQETLAHALGMSHQAVSKMEQSDTIDEEKLEKVAAALGVSVEAIKNFDEQAVLNFTQNNYEGSHANQGYAVYPSDQYVESVAEIKRLYEQLLQAEKEKSALLAAMLQHAGIDPAKPDPSN